MMINYETIFHSTELMALGGIAWRAIRAANALQNSLDNFPLHRHVGKRILYTENVDVEAGNFDTVIANGEQHR